MERGILAMAMNFAKGHTMGKQTGVSHKMHAFKEALGDRSAGDT